MKLLLAIMLSIGIALGGCATTIKTPGTTSTIPNMEYVDVDFFNNGVMWKVPSHIDANSPVWLESFEQISEDILVASFTFQYEKMVWIVNIKDLKVLLAVYNKTINTPDMEFYIYDGKPYPVLATEEEANTYIKKLNIGELVFNGI